MFNFGRKKQDKVTLQVAPEANLFKVFGIKDAQLKMFGELIHAPDVEDVRQGMIHLFREKKNQDNVLVLYPEKFDVFELGTFHKETGKVTGLDAPVHHFSLTECKN